MKKLHVVSLGGSLIFPEKVDIVFLRKFIELIRKQTALGNRFIIVTGGGRICRDYNAALEALGKPSDSDLDWMGISLTHANATLLRLSFGSLAHPRIVTDLNKKTSFREKILVAGGWKPGWSTDFVAVKLAAQHGARKIINLSNIDYVYDSDPRKNPKAKKLENVSWQNFEKIVGTKWNPGANVPFDPVASKFARAHGQTVIIANGQNFKNLKTILAASPKFIGTQIS